MPPSYGSVVLSRFRSNKRTSPHEVRGSISHSHAGVLGSQFPQLAPHSHAGQMDTARRRHTPQSAASRCTHPTPTCRNRSQPGLCSAGRGIKQQQVHRRDMLALELDQPQVLLAAILVDAGVDASGPASARLCQQSLSARWTVDQGGFEDVMLSPRSDRLRSILRALRVWRRTAHRDRATASK